MFFKVLILGSYYKYGTYKCYRPVFWEQFVAYNCCKMGVVDTFKLMVAVECERLCNREKQNVPDLKLDSAWPSWHFCTEVRLQWTMKNLTPLPRRNFQQIIITATLWSHVSLSNNLQLMLWPLISLIFLPSLKGVNFYVLPH